MRQKSNQAAVTRTAKPYTIRVSSQKGGVGKTTLSVNLATALVTLGYDVLLIDADPINPSVGFLLGLEDVNIGTKDVLLGKVSARKCIIKHDVTGMSVLPGVPYGEPYLPNEDQKKTMLEEVKKMDYDFIIVDTPPGFYVGSIGKNYDEGLIISTPDMSAVTSCIRLAEIYNKDKLKNSLIVNRVRNKRYELSIKEIEDTFGAPALAVLPEDDVVPKSTAFHIPAYLMDQRAPFCAQLRKAAFTIAGNVEKQPVEAAPAHTPSLQPNTSVIAGIIGTIRRLLGLD